MPIKEKKTSPAIVALFVLIGLLIVAGVFEYLYLRAIGEPVGFDDVKEFVLQERVKAAEELTSTCPIEERVVFSAASEEESTTSDIYMLCLANGMLLNITNDKHSSFVPQLSPDGTTVYYYAPRSGDLEFNDWEIWVSDISGENRRILSDNPRADTFPSLSPDGTKLAFASDEGGVWQLHVMDVDGTNERTVPTDGVLNTTFVDSNTIVFTQYDEQRLQDLFKYDIATDTVTRITKTPIQESSPSVSPDGRYILFDSRKSGTFEIYKLDVDSGEVVQLTDTPGNSGLATFSYDGKRVIFVSNREGTLEMYSMTINGTNQRMLTGNLGLFNVRDPAFAAKPN